MPPHKHAEADGLLGALCPGKKKLLGKIFYLDNVKKRTTALILETISLLGGGVESFLHKDVSFVVTGRQEYLKQQKCADTKAAEDGPNDETQHPAKTQKGVLSKEKKRPGTPRPMACGSRGKALLEKAIRNNELHRSSVLANAQSWGVKILFVDDVLLYLKRLSRESFSATHKKSEKTCSKQGSHVVKAAALKSPFIKIEDVSRKYKPLHTQSLAFPSLWYSGRFSPFESPPPLFEKQNKPIETKTREKKKSIEDKPLTPLSSIPSPWRPRKKELSYCECCQQHFSHLEEHLQSAHHRAFVLDVSNYAAVDQLVAEMVPGFSPKPPPQSEDTPNRPLTPMPIQDVRELEPVDDMKAEQEVRALQRRASSPCDHSSGPRRGPCTSRPAGPSPELLLIHPKPPVLSADTQPLTKDVVCQIPGTSSPLMPVLAVEAHDFDPSRQLQDTRRPCPSSDVPCPPFDPYSQPPVLSPQVPVVMEPRSPYSEPPVLSPKQPLKEQTSEMETADDLFCCVPSVTLTFSTPAVASGDRGKIQEGNCSHPRFLSEPSDSGCPSSRLRSAALCSRRSRSLPRPPTVGQHPKKRCRSASPGNNHPKKRRMLTERCHSGQLPEPLKAGNDVLAGPEAWLPSSLVGRGEQRCPHPAPARAAELSGFKKTLAMLPVPSLEPVSHTPTQTAGSVLQHRSEECHSAECQPPAAHSTSACMESVLVPDLAMLSSSSSDSNWDCEVLSRLAQNSGAPQLPTDQDFELDEYLLHGPRTWAQDSNYESRLHTALQPSASGKPLFGEDADSSGFSRTVVKIVEVSALTNARKRCST